ncbi:hypothetical protein EJB05_31793, partial [Eragrostis curvula]
MPDKLWQCILTKLPLMEVIRTGALALSWHDLWKCRWSHRSYIKINLHFRDDQQRELDALPQPHRRLSCFFLIVLHVETWKGIAEEKLNFHLPLSSPLLTDLSLRCISVAKMYSKGAKPFHALEVIRLHFVLLTQAFFRKMTALCPNLGTLDQQSCSFNYSRLILMPTNLRSVTIAECDDTAYLN